MARSSSRSLTSSLKVTSRPTDLGSGRSLRTGEKLRPRASWRRAWAPAEGGGEQRERHVLQHADGGEAEGGEPLLGDGADAADLSHRQITQTAVHVGGSELADAGRFVEVGGQFGEQLGGSDADGAGDRVRVVDLLLDAVGDGPRRAEEPPAAGDVEEGLVDGRHLDEVRVVPQELDQRAVDGEIGLHVHRQEHPVRAEPLGLCDGQRAVDAVDARLVGAGRDHAPPPALAADDDRQTAQLGAARLLHRGEEGVHVEVEDCSAWYEHMFVAYPGGGRMDNMSGAGVDRRRSVPAARDGYCTRRPRSTVYMTTPEMPWNVPRAHPMPTLRQRLVRITRRCALECIQARKMLAGVPLDDLPQAITSPIAQCAEPLANAE